MAMRSPLFNLLVIYVALSSFSLSLADVGVEVCSDLFRALFHDEVYDTTDSELSLLLTRQEQGTVVRVSWSFLEEDNPAHFDIRLSTRCGNITENYNWPYGTGWYSFPVPTVYTCTVYCCYRYDGYYYYKILVEQLPSGISSSIQPSIIRTNTPVQLPAISMDDISFIQSTLSYTESLTMTVQLTRVPPLQSIDTVINKDFTDSFDMESSLDIESISIDIESATKFISAMIDLRSTEAYSDSSIIMNQEFTLSTLLTETFTSSSDSISFLQTAITTTPDLSLSSSNFIQISSSSSLSLHTYTSILPTTPSTAISNEDPVINITGEAPTSNIEIVVAILASVIATSFFIVLIIAVWSCCRRYLSKKRLKVNGQLDILESHHSTTAVVILEISPSPSLLTIYTEPVYEYSNHNTSPTVQCRNSSPVDSYSPLLTRQDMQCETQMEKDNVTEKETTLSTKTGSVSSDDSSSDITVAVMERVNNHHNNNNNINRVLQEGVLMRQLVLQDSSSSSAGDITSEGSLAYYRITDEYDIALQDRSSSLINVVFV